MKANIEVTDRREADAIRAGLADPFTRAIVVMQGLLATLPSARSRMRVLEFVRDRVEEENEQAQTEREAP
jgi:hypothetical protein